MRFLVPFLLATALSAAPPAITELQPRGTQKGRPFQLTVVGQNLGEGATMVKHALAANFFIRPPSTPRERRPHSQQFAHPDYLGLG